MAIVVKDWWDASFSQDRFGTAYKDCLNDSKGKLFDNILNPDESLIDIFESLLKLIVLFKF